MKRFDRHGKSHRTRWLTTVAGVMAVTTSFTYPAHAQQNTVSNAPATGNTDQVSSESDNQAASDDIVVTAVGTNIAGVKPVGSETITLGRDQILKTGVSTVADAIRTLPQVKSLGDFREGGTQGSYNAQQGNAINLRGLGAQATLTLVDGHRVVATGAASNFTEANQVPLAAIERIEVIADGASALYGSDAVAGVVNYVLRKDFSGVEAGVRVTNQTGGMEYSPSLTAGAVWGDLAGIGRGNILISYEYTSRDAYAGSKSPLFSEDLTRFGGPDNRLNGTNATVVGAANIIVPRADGSQNPILPRAGANDYYGLPTGANVGLGAANLLFNRPNIGDSAQFSDYVGKLTKHQVSLFANQQLGSNVEVFVQGSYTNRETDSRTLNYYDVNVTLSPFLFNSAGAVTSTPNPYYISGIPGVAPGANLNVQYSALKDLGPSSFFSKSETYGVTGGVRANLPGNWKGEASYTYGHDYACNFCQIGTQLNFFGLQYRINTGDINPLSSTPLTSAQKATVYGFSTQYSTNGLSDLILKFNGPLFSLPGGTVRGAFGGERNSLYNFNETSGSRTQLNEVRFDTTEDLSRLERTISSAFAELYVPLIGPEMGVPLVQSLIVDGAVRYDHYSDVGNTTNPKVGVTWRVSNAFKLRGSWGTSFRAPSLPDINLQAYSQSFGFPATNRDPRVTNGFLNLPQFGLTFANVALVLGSNPNLVPEKAKNWSAGGDLELGEFRFSATYYNISYTNRISIPNVLNAYLAGRYPSYDGFAANVIPISNPNTCSNANPATADPTLQPFLAGILYGSLPDFCAVNVLINQRNANLAATRQDGLDGNVQYEHRMGEFGVNASVAASWTISNDEQVVKGTPFNDRLGFYSTPVEWRGRGSLGATWRALSSNLFINYTGSYTNDLAVDALGNSIANKKVDPWVTADFTLSYATSFRERIGGVLSGLRGSFTVLNVTNESPPIVVTGQGAFNGSYSNPYGRTFTAQLTASF